MMDNINTADTISLCHECYDICLEALVGGFQEGGQQLAEQHIKRLVACREICETTASFLTINAPFRDKIAELCAEICEQCANSCETKDSPLMHRCADICKRCAKACIGEVYSLRRVA